MEEAPPGPELAPLDLGDRLLWPDGDITVSPEQVPALLGKLVSLAQVTVTEVTPDIAEFNRTAERPLREKTELKSVFPPAWNLPDRYKYDLKLDEYLLALGDRVERDELYEARLLRLAEEICLFRDLGLNEVLRTLIYVVETLEAKGVVWGVGRGSSCSSYLLYLLGLHEVDAVRYDIKITDFLKT